MSTLILDGRKTREKLMPALKERLSSLGYTPTIAIIQVGDRPDSTAFIKAKKSFATKVGVAIKMINASDTISQTELIDIVKECNNDKSIHGIIVQLPLPIVIDRDAVIESISPKKDVDALTSFNVKRWLEGREDAIMPATARGVRTLLKDYGIEVFGKKVVMIGRSMLVGKPIINMLLNENATVTVCHSKTSNLAKHTKAADIVVVAAGHAGLITAKHVGKNQIVIDIGINTVTGEKLDEEIEETKLVGDVDFEKVSKKVKAISPVPGGVGPMTVFSLFENLADLLKPL